uniref:RNA-binding protein n=1 Tax=Macrostomum lignano TaxID=282301 RepID=A0A1I8FGK5_9PLAT
LPWQRTADDELTDEQIEGATRSILLFDEDGSGDITIIRSWRQNAMRAFGFKPSSFQFRRPEARAMQSAGRSGSLTLRIEPDAQDGGQRLGDGKIDLRAHLQF